VVLYSPLIAYPVIRDFFLFEAFSCRVRDRIAFGINRAAVVVPANIQKIPAYP
jgi:hypothetical protein